MTVLLKSSIFLLFADRSKETISQSHLTVVRVDDLEVLDGGQGDTSVEVEHV